jgi:hypothetical protein
LDLGPGNKEKYTEVEKVEMEQKYMEVSGYNIIKQDIGIQV